MACFSFFSFFLVFICLKQVQSGAVSPVFVQRGKDVLLNVNSVPENSDFFVWRFNTRGYNLVIFSSDNKPTVTETYAGRIDFSETNSFSVTLKNLQHNDTGVYTARVTKDDDHILAEYNIIQDPVSPVELKVDSVSSSSDSCNVTVSCSTLDAHISSTFTHVHQSCDQDGGERSIVTNSTASLQVYMRDQQVICEHSNQVSRTNNQTEIHHLCLLNAGSTSFFQDISFCLLKTVVFSSGLLIMVSAVISVHLMDKFRKQK